MDHVVYVIRSSEELEGLLDGERSEILRGSLAKRLPYGRVADGDRLFFATGNGRSIVRAAAEVSGVCDSEKLAGEACQSLIAGHMSRLKLSDDEVEKWSGKKYLTLIGVTGASPVVPFTIDAHGSGENDDWIVLENIDEIIE